MTSDPFGPDRLTTACRSTLLGWQPPDRSQDRLRADYLHHLGSRPHPWSRSCTGAHLTASALICVPTDRRVLLTLHARIGRWLQTGGHLEAGDRDLAAGAFREATEESGLAGLRLDPVPLRLDRHEVPCGTVRPTYHLDVRFLAVAEEQRRPTVTPESADVAWFDVDAFPRTDASVVRLVEAARERLGWSAG